MRWNNAGTTAMSLIVLNIYFTYKNTCWQCVTNYHQPYIFIYTCRCYGSIISPAIYHIHFYFRNLIEISIRILKISDLFKKSAHELILNVTFFCIAN